MKGAQGSNGSNKSVTLRASLARSSPRSVKAQVFSFSKIV